MGWDLRKRRRKRPLIDMRSEDLLNTHCQGSLVDLSFRLAYEWTGLTKRAAYPSKGEDKASEVAFLFRVGV